MNKNRISLFLLLAVAVSPCMHADIVFLKDGSQCNGEILSDGPDGITIEYFATATIKDQKTIARADIDRVEKVSPDLKAYEELGSLASPETLMETSFLDPLLDQKIPEFMRSYPYSSKIEEVRGKIKVLEDERMRIRQGDRRIDGIWFTAAEIAADPYQSGARIKYLQMKSAANSNNPVEALRSYELLEKDFPGSEVMPDGVDGALKQLDLLQGAISSARFNGDLAEKNRAKAIAVAPADQAKILKEGVDHELNATKEFIKKSAADGSKFFPVFQNSKEALDDLQELVVAERTRLMQLQKTPVREGIAAAKECARLIKQGKLKEAQEQLALSQKLWPINIDNTKLKASLEQANKQPSPKS